MIRFARPPLRLAACLVAAVVYVRTDGAGLKPPCHGLMIRDYSPGRPLPAFIDSVVVQVDWADLESADQVFDGPGWAKIDAARRACSSLRLRVFAGTRAPEFVKRLGDGPVGIWNPVDRAGGATSRFWEPVFLDHYEQLMRELARRYDDAPEVAEVVASGCMTLYAEPFFRAHADVASNRRLHEAGLDFDRDLAAQRRVIEIHARVFQRTRTSLALNAWDIIEGPPAFRRADFAATAAFADWARELMGERLVLQNNSASPRAAANLGARTANPCAYLNVVAGPKGFQTRTFPRLKNVDGLYATLEAALGMGAWFVELPAGFASVSDPDVLAAFDRRLEANATPGMDSSSSP